MNRGPTVLKNHLPEEEVESFCEQKKWLFSLPEVCPSPLYLFWLRVPVTEHYKVIENKLFVTFLQLKVEYTN